ncbi:MAG: PAS domain S-box protein [Chloroflexi bacterium]|nr:PAS domain S-box protein [Chloroflexota bacterium]
MAQSIQNQPRAPGTGGILHLRRTQWMLIGSIILLAVLTGVLLLGTTLNTNQAATELTQIAEETEHIVGTQHELLRLHIETERALDAENPNWPEVDTQRTVVGTQYKSTLDQISNTPQLRQELAPLADSLFAYDRLMSETRANMTPAMREAALEQLYVLLRDAERNLNQVYDRQEERFLGALSNSLNTIRFVQTTVMLVGALSIILFVVLVLSLVRSIRSDFRSAYTLVQEEKDQVARTEHTLRSQNTYLDTLQRIAVGLIGRLDVEGLLQEILSRAGELVGTSNGYVFLLDPEKDEMVMRVGVGAYQDFVNTKATRGVALAGRVWESGQALVVDDYQRWGERLPDPSRNVLRAIIGVPLIVRERVTGILGLAHLDPQKKFGPDELDLLTRLAALAAVALDNARLYDAAQTELAQRRSVEAALAYERDLLQAIMDTLPDLIFFKDRESRFVRSNAAHLQNLGAQSMDQIRGKTDADFHVAVAAHDFAEDENRVIATGIPILNKLEANPELDGTERYFSTSKVPWRDAQGNIIGTLGVAHNVTQTVLAEKRLAAEVAERERTEAELRKLTRAVEQSPVSIVITDLSGNIEYANPTYTEKTGYLNAELLGRNQRAFKSGQVAPQVYKQMWETITAGQKWQGELLNRKKNGGLFWELVVIAPIFDTQGVITHYVGIKEDISERRRAQDALRASEERYRDLFENANDLIQSVRADGHFEYVNRRWKETFGYSDEEISALKFLDIIPPEHHSSARAQSLRVLAGETLDSIEAEFVAKDGRKILLEGSATARRVDGQVVSTRGIFRDVTERRRVQEQVDVQAAALDSAANTIIITDIKGKILWVNRAFTAGSGYTLEEAAGNTPSIMKSGLHDAAFYRNLWETILSGNAWRGEMINRRKNGELYYEEKTITPVRNIDGEIFRFVAIGLDITERKRAEETLLRFQRAIEQLTDAVFMTDPQGNILYVNSAFEKIYGYSAAEALGKTPRILKSGLLTAEQYRDFWATLLNKQPISGEILNRNKHGHLVPIEGTNVPIVDDSDNLIGFVSVHRDITERKRAQEREAYQNALIAAQNQVSPDGILVVGPDDKILSSNRRFLELWGIPSEVLASASAEALRQAVRDNVVDRDIWLQSTTEIYKQRDASSKDELRFENGRIMERYSAPVTSAAGEYLARVWFFHDVTEMRRAQNLLHQSEQRLFKFMNALPVGVFVVDAQGKPYFANDTAIEMLGKGLDPYATPENISERYQVIEVATGQIAPPKDLPLLRALAGEKMTRNDIAIHRADRDIPMQSSATPIYDEQGRIEYAVAAWSDLTLVRRAEQDVRRQNVYLNALQETTVGLISRLDVDALLQDIVKHAGALAGTEHGYVFIKEPGAEEMELRVGTGAYEGFVGRRTRRGVGLAGQIWESNRPIAVDDYRTWSGRLADASRDILRAVAGFPLRSGSEVIGVIGLATLDAERKFGAQEIEVLQRFAQLAAIALDNARLYESAQEELKERTRAENELARELRETEFVGRVTAHAVNLDADSALREICGDVANYFGVPVSGIALLDPEHTTATVVADYSPPGSPSVIGFNIPVKGNPSAEIVLATRKPAAFSDAQNDPRLAAIHDLMKARGTVSILIAPLFVRDEIIGTLGIDSSTPREFDSRGIALVERVAVAISTALENARLYNTLQQELAERTRAEAEARQRNLELESLNRVASAMMSDAELYTALGEMAQELVRTFRARNCGIALLSPDQAALTVVADALVEGHEQRAVGIVIPVQGNASSEYVIQNKKTLVIDDPQNDPMTATIHERMRDRRTTCLAIIPLLAGDQVIGTIGLDTTEEGRVFSNDEIRVAETMAAQMAGAIEKQRLLEATQFEVVQRARAEKIQNTLFRIADAVNTAQTATDFYATLQRLIGELMYAPNMYVALYDAPEDILEFPYFKDERDQLVDPIRRRERAGKRVTKWVIQKGEPLLIDTAMTFEMVERGEIEIHGNPAVQWLGIPLKRGNQTFGMFGLQSYTEEHRYSDADKELLMTLSPEIANAITRREEQDTLIRRNRELAVLNRVAQVVSQSTELSTTLRQVAREVVEVFEARNCGITLYSPDKTELIVVASATRSPDEPDTVGVRIPLENNLSTQHVLQTRESLVIADAQTDPLTAGVHDLMKQLRTRSLMIVPLLSGGQVIGTVGVDSTDLNRIFTPEEVRLAETLAIQMANAIEKQSQFDQARERARREQRSREIGARLTRSLDVDAIVQTMARELSQVLGASHAVVRMGSAEKHDNGEQGHS